MRRDLQPDRAYRAEIGGIRRDAGDHARLGAAVAGVLVAPVVVEDRLLDQVEGGGEDVALRPHAVGATAVAAAEGWRDVCRENVLAMQALWAEKSRLFHKAL